MTKISQRYVFVLLVILTSCLVNSCFTGDEEFFLQDRAGVLTTQEQERIIDYNRILLKDLDIHFKLIILAEEANDINALAADIFGDLGKQTGGAKGLLFLVDPQTKQVRIEVGYDLEAIFTDGFVGYLESAQMVPFFEVGRVGPGVEATTELFVARMQRAQAGNEFDADQELGVLGHYSGGGGAKVNVGTDNRSLEKKSSGNMTGFEAQDSPEATLEAYKEVLRTREKDPGLPLYTPETREFFSQWVVTDAQQNNALRALEQATPEKVIISDDYAVIRYPARQRTQSPYFLRKGEQGWMLDFLTMNRVIRMNHKNQWRFTNFEHPYKIGFSDWQFDKNGFPIVGN